jgi:Zn-dependent peptidase ImmA (M78 family)/DNA-binding XRE family transcriptional regulator
VALDLLQPDEIGRRVRAVREEVGVTVATLAERLGVSYDVVQMLEAGLLDPLPGDYILTIADTLRTDYRYFISEVLDQEEASVTKVYRALAEPTAADKLAIRRFVNFAIAENELADLTHETRVALPPPNAPRGRLHKEQGVNAAVQERKRLGLGNRPIQNIFELIRANGVRLFRHGLTDSKLAGLTVVHPRAGVAVLINYVDDLYRQFFSAAHEYGHVLLDRGQLESQGCIVTYYSRRELIEIRANAFAGEFLLPREAMKRFDSSRRTMSQNDIVLNIAREYQVNTGTVAIKMGEVGWMDPPRVQEFLSPDPPVRIPRAEKGDPEVPSTLTEKQAERRLIAIKEGFSTSYLEMLRRALVAGEITWGRATELLDLDGDDSRGFMSAVGAVV